MKKHLVNIRKLEMLQNMLKQENQERKSILKTPIDNSDEKNKN